MPSGHTVVAFDTELATLHRKIAEMGGLAEEQLIRAMEALVSRDENLAGSIIAKEGIFSERQWYRVKPAIKALGICDYRHRSIESGLAQAGGEKDLQVSDIYWFTPERLVPWLREIYDRVLARIKANTKTETRTPLVKRDRPHRRIAAFMNPFGYSRAVAAMKKPAPSHADQEARALAFATEWARNAPPI